MTREEYYKQRSKERFERFERFCKFLDLHFYVNLYADVLGNPSSLLDLTYVEGAWKIHYNEKKLTCKVTLINGEQYSDSLYLIPTTFRRVLLEGCRRLNTSK